MKRIANGFVILTFLLTGGFTASPAAVESATPQGADEHSLTTGTIPPENCNAPLGGPFGRDVEALRGGDTTYREDFVPAWQPPQTVTPNAVNSVSPYFSAAAIDVGRVAMAWEEEGLPMKFAVYEDLFALWVPQEFPSLSDAPEGIPAVIPTLGSGNFGKWEVFTHTAGKIQHILMDDYHPGTWAALPGVEGKAAAASSPAVINLGTGHQLVFYRDPAGRVRFTENQSGVWRSSPVLLDTPLKYSFLPLIARQAAAKPGIPFPDREDQPAEILPSELSAVSRNANHAAVFFVDAGNRLWVDEWTPRNRTDWQDTHWQLLMKNVLIEKPAVVSRNSNNLAVVVRDTNKMAYLIEWTPDLNQSGKAGWKQPFSLQKALDGPPALAAPSANSLAVFAVSDTEWIWQRTWQQDGGWGAWVQLQNAVSGVQPAQMVITPVVNHPDDMMLLYPALSGSNLVPTALHFTSESLAPAQTAVGPNSTTKGYPRSQALAWVDGKSLWVTAHETALADPWFWQVDASEVGGSGPLVTRVLDNEDHYYSPDASAYLDAADVDWDGDDEVMVASYDPNTSEGGFYRTVHLSVLDLNFTPGLQISVISTKAADARLEDSPWATLSMALGDLDGDGRKNEVVLARKEIATDQLIQLTVFQYDAASHTLVEKVTAALSLDLKPATTYRGSQVQVATGNVSASTSPLIGAAGQQIAVSSLAYYIISNAYRVFPTIRSYSVEITNGAWAITLLPGTHITSQDEEHWTALLMFDGPSSTSLADVQGLYSSALDTGDIDGDSYDEIALGYSNMILWVDHRDSGGRIGFAHSTFDPTYDQAHHWLVGPRWSLAVGDLDLDGRAEILGEMYVKPYDPYTTDYIPKLIRFEYPRFILTPSTSILNLPTPGQGGRLDAILIGDTDGDSFVSELDSCADLGDFRIVAVLNGAPRWYANGTPINESRGTYSEYGENKSGTEYGTTFLIKNSFSFGYKQSFKVPSSELGAEVRASFTMDWMEANGIRNSSEVYNSYGSGKGFEATSLGEVVYEVIPYRCNFYNVYPPDAPEEISSAMACVPGPQRDTGTGAMSLEKWRNEGRTFAGASWVDVGHRTSDGVYTNDLMVAGNYSSHLPVDEFAVLHIFPTENISWDIPGQHAEWTYEEGSSGSLTEFHQKDESYTVSAGASLVGIAFDYAWTTSYGREDSETMSWGDKIAFYGRIYQFPNNGRPCYQVTPFVYQATATTQEGASYPYWEMDYYVPKIGSDCY